MKPFVVNRHGRLVFPSNFLGELDFTVIDTAAQLAAVVKRDFEAKAPTGTEIEAKANEGSYRNRYQLLRDLALTLFWGNRYAITMYDKRPTRWRDVPRTRDDVFLPVLEPWNRGAEKVKAMQDAYASLPAKWDAEAEDRIAQILLPPFEHKLHLSTGLPAIKPTVAEMLADPSQKTSACRTTTRTSRSSVTRRSWTARRRCRSWRRWSGWRWCSTTSIRGTARRRR
jgi:3-oxoacyl-[acyl-carrier-protein] synthase-3